MVNSASMSSERAIPDLWDVFGSRGGGLAIRRNSWQKMQKQLMEEEQAVTDLFNDLHVHADLPAENNSPAKHKQNASQQQQRNRTADYNERNKSSSANNQQHQQSTNWEHIEKHLSMKKTIRKKMCRDLQQAFIDGQEPPDAAQRWDHVQLEAHKVGVEPNLLDLLKETKKADGGQSNPVTTPAPPPPAKKPGFWKKLTMRKSNSKR